MGHIFTYELRRRAKMMIMFASVIVGMTVISMILSAIFKLDLITMYRWGANKVPAFAVIWWVLTVIAMYFVGIAMFFTCCNGHINEMLFKDTNYLILTIPLPAWKIILGRWLAGLVEYVAYLLLILICGIAWLNFIIPKLSGDYSFMQLILLNLTNNPLFILGCLTFVLSIYTLIGMMVIMVCTLMRSFIKKQGIATAGAIVLFIFLFFLLNDFAAKLMDYLDWTWNIPIKGYSTNDFAIIRVTNDTVAFQMVFPFMWTLLAVPFFFVSSWLLEKKVEL